MSSILFYIARYPGYGGIEDVTTLLANYLSVEKRHKVSILSCYQQNEKELLPKLHANVSFFKLPTPTCINTVQKSKLL